MFTYVCLHHSEAGTPGIWGYLRPLEEGGGWVPGHWGRGCGAQAASPAPSQPGRGGVKRYDDLTRGLHNNIKLSLFQVVKILPLSSTHYYSIKYEISKGKPVPTPRTLLIETLRRRQAEAVSHRAFSSIWGYIFSVWPISSGLLQQKPKHHLTQNKMSQLRRRSPGR